MDLNKVLTIARQALADNKVEDRRCSERACSTRESSCYCQMAVGSFSDASHAISTVNSKHSRACKLIVCMVVSS
jgi:hypothetical protein